MTGYVVADKPELKVKEFELYKSYYCGVCRSIGRRYGQFQRMVLSYDSAFLAALLFALVPEQETVVQEHCMVHPVRKRNICIDNPAVDYAADIMLILAYKNIIDDINDDGKLWLRAPEIMFRGTYAKLAGKYPEICDITEKELAALTALEEEKCSSLDQTSDTFARIMEAAAAGMPGLNDETQRLILKSIGFHLGKWMYIIDAIDDLIKDLASGNYNPLVYRYEFDRSSETPEEFRNRIMPQVRFLLFHFLGEMAKAYNLLDIRKNRGLIENIIFLGLNSKTEEITGNSEDKDKNFNIENSAEQAMR